MLTLTRKAGESIRIGDDICIFIKEVKGRQVRIGISAPKDVYVCREELFLKIQEANLAARVSAAQLDPEEEASALAAMGSLMRTTPSTADHDQPRLTSAVVTRAPLAPPPAAPPAARSRPPHAPLHHPLSPEEPKDED